MAVYDRWHVTNPKSGSEKCKEHKLYPSEDHNKGDRWQVRYRDARGHQKKKNFALKTGRNPDLHAEAYDAKIKGELSQGSWIDPSKEKTLLKDLVVVWKEKLRGDLRTKSNKTGKAERSIVPHLGDLSLGALIEDSSHIQKWINHLEEERGFAPNTVLGYKKVLTSIFSFAVKIRYINSNPLMDRNFVDIEYPPKRKIIPYTQEELKKLEEELEEEFKSIFFLGSQLGLRIGEIFALSPDDVMDHGVLHVATQLKRVDKTYVFALPKGRKTRIVPLPTKTRNLIKSLPTKPMTLPWDSPKSRKLVTINVCVVKKDIGPFNPESVRRNWVKACMRSGIRSDRAGFHYLRHTYASRLLAAGIDVRALSEFLGHADPGFTLRTYCHLMTNAGDAARRAIDDVP